MRSELAATVAPSSPRFRLLMIPSVIEKLGYVVVLAVLSA
jgi:hypothetical protein